MTSHHLKHVAWSVTGLHCSRLWLAKVQCDVDTCAKSFHWNIFAPNPVCNRKYNIPRAPSLTWLLRNLRCGLMVVHSNLDLHSKYSCFNLAMHTHIALCYFMFPNTETVPRKFGTAHLPEHHVRHDFKMFCTIYIFEAANGGTHDMTPSCCIRLCYWLTS